MTNEMEVLTKGGELIAQEAPTPQELLLAARDAARALKSVIDSNDRPPVSFNGKQYLEYPHWQTIAKFYHCSVATEGAEFVEIMGAPGFKAKAIVIDDNTGIKIGSAEAYCLKDEPNWKNKPMFQLASMAQTRAGAKALANKFRYVAIVAGYEPTPKEEMDGTDLKPAVAMPKAKTVEKAVEAEIVQPKPASVAPEATTQESPEVEKAQKLVRGLITDKQRKMIFAKCRASGISEDALKAFIKEKFKIESTKDLLWQQMDAVLAFIDNVPPNA